MSLPLVAVAGPAGVGKDTLADHLVEKYGYVKWSFASGMKEGLKVALGLTDEQVYGSEKETPIESLDGLTPRHLLQTFGTNWGRDMIHPNVWLLSLKKKWSELNETLNGEPGKIIKGVVIADCRFENEAAWVRGAGGTVIHVKPDGEFKPISGSSHSSESGIDNLSVDFVIKNTHGSGGQIEFHRRIDEMMGWIDRENSKFANIEKIKKAIRSNGSVAIGIAPPLRQLIDAVANFGEIGETLNRNTERTRDDIMHKLLHGPTPRTTGFPMPPVKPPANPSIEEMQKRIAEWADGVFPNRTISNALSKLVMEEIPEYLNAQDDPMELADIAILVFDVAHLAKIDLGAAVRKKMAINDQREWEICGQTGLMNHVK